MHFTLTIVFLAGLLGSTAAHAQNATARAAKEEQPVRAAEAHPEVYEEEETDPIPQYKGGEAALREMLARTTIVPQYAVNKQFGATVDVQFVLWPDGRMDSLHVANPVCCGLDEEAMRVVRATNGSWSPGIYEGKPVPTRVEVNVPFKVLHQTNISIKRLNEMRAGYPAYQQSPEYQNDQKAYQEKVQKQQPHE